MYGLQQCQCDADDPVGVNHQANIDQCYGQTSNYSNHSVHNPRCMENKDYIIVAKCPGMAGTVPEF